MAKRHKVLLLDDDQDLLELYREMLSHMPSQPEIHTASSGARALALLESEKFTLLISDLSMPRMDGLQVLTIVRRKFPELRTAVMTSVVDEQFRSRAYSMGVDLFLEKPNNQQEIRFFLDCIESLLGKEEAGGFRGVQSKSLVDIIQLECLSRSSSVMKITRGSSEGRIWLQDGEIFDAAVQDLVGEPAFQKILSWKTGGFEILPGEPDRPRTIFTPYQSLLLETAQALDEASPQALAEAAEEAAAAGLEPASPTSPLSQIVRFRGVEFAVAVPDEPDGKVECWGAQNPGVLADWIRNSTKRFREVGDLLGAGPLGTLEGSGPQRQFSLITVPGARVCVSFDRSTPQEVQREIMKQVVDTWVS